MHERGMMILSRGPVMAARIFHENHRVLRYGDTGFFGMKSVIESNAENGSGLNRSQNFLDSYLFIGSVKVTENISFDYSSCISIKGKPHMEIIIHVQKSEYVHSLSP